MFYFAVQIANSVRFLIVAKYAIIDVETTGGAARYERITEIAIVLHDGEKVIDTFSTLLNPERSIPWNITQITGITDAMVADAPKFFEVARQIVQMTEDAIFVAHNVSFDFSFIREEFARLGYTYSRRQLCTVRLARKTFPGLPSYSLSNLKKHFGIAAERSHRALDDTLATVTLFERILSEQDGRGQIRQMVNHGVKETRLPQGLTLERLHAVPDGCGVYYLHSEQGDVIYVGKSLNIRKRLFEHFADPTPKGEKLRSGVADISYELTGSELVALLLESAEIKRLQPYVNRAQRHRQHLGAIYCYTDANGYTCLLAGKPSAKAFKGMQRVADFHKFDHARNFLQQVARHLELCDKLCGLDHHERACFQHAIKKCHGACIGAELPEAYNLRAAQALALFKRRLQGSFFLVDEGRTDGEKAVVGVRDGEYVGYGFFEMALGEFSPGEVWDNLKKINEDPDAPGIIRGFLDGKKRVKTVPVLE